MSVSLWSLTLYLPTCSMAALLVANISIEFSRVMTMSLEIGFSVWASGQFGPQATTKTHSRQ